MGILLAFKGPVAADFFQHQEYRKLEMFDAPKELVKGWLAVITIAPFFFVMRFSCSHIGSNGIMLSHLQAVVPYGGSVKTMSTEPSGMPFIISRQSPFIKFIVLMPSYLLRGVQ
jgi:hypothetical protein